MKCCHWLHRVLGAGVLLAASTLPAIAAGDDADKNDNGEALFKQLDRNNDGEIVADELGPEQQRMFQRLLRTNDKNSDGKLSRAEFQESTKETPPARDGEGRGPRGEGRPGPEQFEAIFKRLDANGDGKVVIEEVPEDRRQRFAVLIERADADGDKSLTLVEFTKGMGAMVRGGRGDGQPGQRPGTPPGPPPPPPGDALFKALDTNDDGKLSKSEIQAAPQSLEKLDRDSDGEITRRELGGPRPYSAAGRSEGSQGEGAMAIIQRRDTNNDGKLSKDETPDWLKERFDRIDTNDDGFIQAEEMQRAMAAMGGGRGRPGGGDQGRPSGQQLLKRLDTNQDGKLSKDEATIEWLQHNFDRLDANDDGFIDAGELARSAPRNREDQPGDRKPRSDDDQKKDQN